MWRHTSRRQKHPTLKEIPLIWVRVIWVYVSFGYVYYGIQKTLMVHILYGENVPRPGRIVRISLEITIHLINISDDDQLTS